MLVLAYRFLYSREGSGLEELTAFLLGDLQRMKLLGNIFSWKTFYLFTDTKLLGALQGV